MCSFFCVSLFLRIFLLPFFCLTLSDHLFLIRVICIDPWSAFAFPIARDGGDHGDSKNLPSSYYSCPAYPLPLYPRSSQFGVGLSHVNSWIDPCKSAFPSYHDYYYLITGQRCCILADFNAWFQARNRTLDAITVEQCASRSSANDSLFLVIK